MQRDMEGFYSRLQRALDERLAVYERYVVSPHVLMDYVEGTKRTLLTVVADVFDRKLEELSHKGGSRRTSPGVMRPRAARSRWRRCGGRWLRTRSRRGTGR